MAISRQLFPVKREWYEGDAAFDHHRQALESGAVVLRELEDGNLYAVHPDAEIVWHRGLYRGDPERIPFAVTHAGRVLATRERNWSDDSDFYAIVWDGERLRDIEYATTRLGGTDRNSASRDATPEVIAAVQDWQTEQNIVLLRAQEEQAWMAAAYEATQPGPGRLVRVVRGKKVSIGTEGVVKRLYDGQWGESALLAVDGQDTWVSVQNLKVVEPEIPALEHYRHTDEEVRTVARQMAESTWTMSGSRLGAWVIR